MKAMILAAGLGTRLRPLTERLPKPLLPVVGRPLVDWNLLLLRRHGITDAIVNLHHLGDLIERELGDGSAFGMRLAYSREPVLLGTGGGLKQAEPFFGGEPFLAINADTLVEIDLGALMAAHRNGRALATMALREDPDADRWGALEVEASGRIARINGRGRQPVGPVKKRMFAGVHIIHPRLLVSVPAERESSIIDAYVGAIQQGETILAHEFSGYWSDIGTPERYAQAQRDAEAGVIDLNSRLVRSKE